MNDYPYDVPMAWNAHSADEVIAWCNEQFGYSLYSDWMVNPAWNVDTYSFRTEAHRNWFIMRWL